MGSINGIKIFIKDENFDHSSEVTEHKVEKGIPLTDNVQRNADIIRINGEIVGETASEDINKIRDFMSNGTLIYYVGRNYTYGNYVITDFSTSHPNTIWGGCSFDMTIKEVRFAKSSYLTKVTASTAKVTNTSVAVIAPTTANTNQDIGSTLDAGKQNVEKDGTSSAKTSTQEKADKHNKLLAEILLAEMKIKSGKNKVVQHTCKKGDNLYTLFFAIDAPYKKYVSTPGIEWNYDKLVTINHLAIIDFKDNKLKEGARIIVGLE